MKHCIRCNVSDQVKPVFLVTPLDKVPLEYMCETCIENTVSPVINDTTTVDSKKNFWKNINWKKLGKIARVALKIFAVTRVIKGDVGKVVSISDRVLPVKSKDP